MLFFFLGGGLMFFIFLDDGHTHTHTLGIKCLFVVLNVYVKDRVVL